MQKNTNSQTDATYQALPQGQFKMYPARFYVTIIYALALSMTSIMLGTLNPIASNLVDIYGYSSLVVNLGGLLFTLMHPIFTFPASYVIDTYGIRVGISVGCALSLIGIMTRLLINQSFVFVILGQVIGGIGRPFILNCQAKISANWYTAKVRGGITQILTLVLNVALIIGIVIPSVFFAGYSYSPQSIEQGQNRAFNLMLFEAILGAIFIILNLVFMKDKPPTPPSQSASMKRQPFKIALGKIVRNKNFILLLLAFGCYFGIFNGLAIILSFLIKPWFNGDGLAIAAAAVGGSPVISGIIGVIIIGPIQRKSGTFKKWILMCMCGSSTAIILFYPLLSTEILAVACLISAFNSFFLIPLVPIMLELACELAFPVGEGFAAGLLFACGNFSGFLMGMILSAIVKGETQMQTLAGLGFCLFIFLVGIALIFFMKEIKNRENAESQSERLRSQRSGETTDNVNNTEYTNQTSEYLPPDFKNQQKQN